MLPEWIHWGGSVNLRAPPQNCPHPNEMLGGWFCFSSLAAAPRGCLPEAAWKALTLPFGKAPAQDGAEDKCRENKAKG